MLKLNFNTNDDKNNNYNDNSSNYKIIHKNE